MMCICVYMWRYDGYISMYDWYRCMIVLLGVYLDV